MFNPGDKVQVARIGDEHFGEVGMIWLAFGDNDEPAYTVQFSDKQKASYYGTELRDYIDVKKTLVEEEAQREAAADYREAEVAAEEAVSTEEKQSYMVVESVKQDRRASYERSLYAEKMANEWERYINSTSTAGMSAELLKAYDMAFRAIGLVIEYEMDLSR